MESRPFSLPLLVFLAIIGWMVIVTAGAGIYHLTHGGLGSGPTELLMSALLVLSAHFITQEPRRREPGSRPERRRILGTRIIFAMSVVLVAFSIYHLLTGGWVSAIAEASVALLLLLADYIALTRL